MRPSRTVEESESVRCRLAFLPMTGDCAEDCVSGFRVMCVFPLALEHSFVATKACHTLSLLFVRDDRFRKLAAAIAARVLPRTVLLVTSIVCCAVLGTSISRATFSVRVAREVEPTLQRRFTHAPSSLSRSSVADLVPLRRMRRGLRHAVAAAAALQRAVRQPLVGRGGNRGNSQNAGSKRRDFHVTASSEHVDGRERRLHVAVNERLAAPVEGARLRRPIREGPATATTAAQYDHAGQAASRSRAPCSEAGCFQVAEMMRRCQLRVVHRDNIPQTHSHTL
jgi:hypothetical protein